MDLMSMAGRNELDGLARLARSGSAAAWGKVYEEMAPSVYRLCQRVLTKPEDAEDATAEVFLKARLHLPQYDPDRPFSPWLYRIAANHCWDELRKRSSHPEVGDSESALRELEDQSPSPQEAVLVSESRESLREAIRGLDDRSRLVLSLRYFAELSYADIAEVLGISPSFVGVLLLRARRSLRRRLRNREAH